MSRSSQSPTALTPVRLGRSCGPGCCDGSRPGWAPGQPYGDSTSSGSPRSRWSACSSAREPRSSHRNSRWDSRHPARAAAATGRPPPGGAGGPTTEARGPGGPFRGRNGCSRRASCRLRRGRDPRPRSTLFHLGSSRLAPAPSPGVEPQTRGGRRVSSSEARLRGSCRLGREHLLATVPWPHPSRGRHGRRARSEPGSGHLGAASPAPGTGRAARTGAGRASGAAPRCLLPSYKQIRVSPSHGSLESMPRMT